MGTIWTIIKLLPKVFWICLTHAPEIISLISEIADMINSIKDTAQRKQAWKELNLAAKMLRQNGDTTEITKVFKKWVGKNRRACRT